MEKLDIKSCTLEEIKELCTEMGQPAFRGGQIFSWLHQKQVSSFDEMTNLPAAFREALKEKCHLNYINIKKRLVSGIDGTVKYLYGLADGGSVESVLMEYKHGNSLCISTQLGCRMGCRFCASTLGGLVRHLTPAEMLDQVYTSGRESGRRVDSIVLMGIGEPLDNFDNVMRFLELLSHPQGLNMSLRHVSLSTCGLVDQIDRLAEKKLPLTLSISLHAPNDYIRRKTMPVANKWDMDTLLAACRRYFATTGRRISFEYALISGVNDSPLFAKELALRLKGMGSHVNLIPVNPVKERSYQQSGQNAVRRFLEVLEQGGITATVRRTLGKDISAACGQLRREEAEKEEGYLD
ncbi:23S rRNA (adenine(2503)-C(2))-methyltransferase RlmN [Oscillospiraceae bacterium MB08-C2-2]|nr:23S rRNA (adenine(2503)-C(2))-methyltransferase RlmN [Oscillospiraceae bacterium MB08-C2-2]